MGRGQQLERQSIAREVIPISPPSAKLAHGICSPKHLLYSVCVYISFFYLLNFQISLFNFLLLQEGTIPISPPRPPQRWLMGLVIQSIPRISPSLPLIYQCSKHLCKDNREHLNTGPLRGRECTTPASHAGWRLGLVVQRCGEAALHPHRPRARPPIASPGGDRGTPGQDEPRAFLAQRFSGTFSAPTSAVIGCFGNPFPRIG